MKKFVFVFLILIGTINAQHKFAWISDTYIGADSAGIKLRNVVAQINSLDSISFVLHTGNITESSKNEEFDLAKSILSELNVPLLIIPGLNDTKWSNSGNAKFVEEWDDDRFFYKKDSTIYIGLNTTIPLSEARHFKPEDLQWLDEKLDNINKSSELILAINAPLNSNIDNWFKVNNLLKDYKIRTVLYGYFEKNKSDTFNEIPAKMAQLVFDNSSKAKFYIVKNDNGSIDFLTVSDDNKQAFESRITKNDSVKITFIDSLQIINNNADIIFQKDIKTTLIAEPIFNNNRIYVADYTGLIRCYNMKGKLLWDYDAFGDIVAKPILYKNQLIISTVQGEISLLNAKNGEQIETIGFDDYLVAPLVLFNHNGDKNLIIPKQTNSNAALLISTTSGKIYCYDLETLQEIWKNESSQGMIQSAPIVIGNQIIFGSFDKHIYSIDASNGSKIWEWKEKDSQADFPLNFHPVTDGKFLYFASPNKYIYSIDLRLGIKKWKTNKFNAYESIGISQNGKDLFVKSQKDKFYIINSRNGKMRKKINVNFGKDKTSVTPIEWNKRIVFTSQNGYLYRINRKLRYKSILFLGTAPPHSVQIIDDSKLLVSNTDGKIFIFNIVND